MTGIIAFMKNPANEMRIATALAAILGLFSSKLPFLADVNPDNIKVALDALILWAGTSGAIAAVQAHAEGSKAAALVANADDAVAVFNQVSGPKQADVVLHDAKPTPPLAVK